MQSELAALHTEHSSALSKKTDSLYATIKSRDEELKLCNERVVQLERLQKFAQDTTLKADGELDALGKEMKQIKWDKKTAEMNAEDLTKQVHKLELRISQLSLAEQSARAEADEIRYKPL